jgi:DNA-binding SARP family transcriptional activator/ABC-type transport system substrate-binding protein
VLGPVGAYGEAGAISVGGPRPRALLAVLLLHANRVVAREQLIDAVWGDSPPDSASHTLDGYVSRLRKALGDGRLTRQPPGYVLHVQPGELDLDRLQELAQSAEAALHEGRPADATRLCGQALGLWRGDPLGNVSGDGFLREEVDYLKQLQLSVLEQGIESELALGRHGRLVAELERLVAAHPLRERFRAQLMLALYRSGRQADALAVYAETRALLVEDLGLDPSAQLRELQRRILSHDPALELSVTVAANDGPAPEPVPGRRRTAGLLVGGAAVLGLMAALPTVLATRGSPGASRIAASSIAFLDSRSGELRGDLPVAASGAGQLRATAGWLWDKKEFGDLLQIDPRTLQIVRSISIGPTIGGFTAGDGGLWFVAADSRTLLRVDPRYGLVTRRSRLSPQSEPNLGPIAESADLAFADGSVWAAHGLAQVDRVDPASGRVIHRFPIRDASLLAVGGGAIWVGSSDVGQLTKIDPATNVIVATARIRPWISALTAGGGFVWASNSERIWKLSPGGELLDTIKTPSDTGSIIFGDGALWVTNDILGTVTRIDPQTDATRDYHVGHLVTITTSRNLVAVDVSPTYLDLVAALKGQVLQVRFSQDWIDDPDPAVGGQPGANEWPWLQQLLYATTARLLTYRDAPAPGGWRLVPEIAASLPAVSPDGRTYTFRIRHGYRFSPPSNQPVTAQTFKYSIERALSPTLGNNAPAVAVASDIVGVDAYRARRSAHVTGIRVRGDALSITLTRPAPDLPERMALAYFAPVPVGTPVVVNGLRDPIPSAGPYYLTHNQGGVVAIVRRNPNYHGHRPRHLDAIVYSPQPNVGEDIAAIDAGKADYIAEPGPAVSGGQLARGYAQSEGSRRRYFTTPLLAIDELAFNTTHGVLRSARLRRAVNLALDRPALAAALGDQATDRYLPPGIPGYRQQHVYPLTGPDAGHARALSGTVREPVTLNVCAQPSCLEVGSIVAADLGRIGIRTVVRHYAGDIAPLTKRPGADIVLARAFAPYPDPVAALRAALGHRYATRLDAIAQLDRSRRMAAAEKLEHELLSQEAPPRPSGSQRSPSSSPHAPDARRSSRSSSASTSPRSASTAEMNAASWLRNGGRARQAAQPHRRSPGTQSATFQRRRVNISDAAGG